MDLKELCESYLEQKEYCEKLQYLSKYDYNERLIDVQLTAWVKLINIRGELLKKLAPSKDMWFYEQD